MLVVFEGTLIGAKHRVENFWMVASNCKEEVGAMVVHRQLIRT